LPLWTLTLAPLGPGAQADAPLYRRIVYGGVLYDPDPEDEDVQREHRPQQETDEDEDEYEERLREWAYDFMGQCVVRPEPRQFAVPLKPSLDLKEGFGGKLQVIVKLANIELTPEKPKYEGGAWHVEGMMVRNTTSYWLHSSSSRHTERSHLRDGNLLPILIQHHLFLPRFPSTVRSMERGRLSARPS